MKGLYLLKTSVVLVSVGLLSAACVPPMSATESLWLDTPQVKNAIELRNARDPKVCFEVTGTANVNAPAAGITGGAHGVIATGKNMDVIDCMQFLFGESPQFDQMRQNKNAKGTADAVPKDPAAPITYWY